MSTADTLKKALRDAATSLETISRLAGKVYDGKDANGEPIPTYMGHHDEVRAYAASRAGVARAELAANEAEKAMSEALERVIAEQQKEIDRLRLMEKNNNERWQHENKLVERMALAVFSVLNHPESPECHFELKQAVMA
ncbi:MAG: hypothetical protein RJA36_930, partial [Pseudomonadota bacterium]